MIHVHYGIYLDQCMCTCLFNGHKFIYTWQACHTLAKYITFKDSKPSSLCMPILV